MSGAVSILAQWLIYFAVYGIIALSFNIEYGFTGIPNFGKVMFVAIGAYAAGVLASSIVLHVVPPHLSTPVHIQAAGEPAYCTGDAKFVFSQATSVMGTGELFLVFLVAVAVAAVAGLVSSILASFPALRLREDFLAITLLAAGEIVRLVTWTSNWPVCGFNGISGIPGPFAHYLETSTLLYAGLALAFLGAAYLYTEYATNSPWGRALKAVRGDEVAAEVYGYNVAKMRAESLMVGSALAGIAGALLVFYSGNVNPNSYRPDMTFEVIAAVILGGAANNLGALLGAAVISALYVFMNASSLEALGLTLPENVAAALPYMKYVLLGVVILLVLLYRPQGILPEGPLKTPLVEKTRRKLEEYIASLGRRRGKAGEG